MGKDDPQRKAGWVCDPEAMSDHNQLPAVGQSDRWRECPTIKQKCSDKDCADRRAARLEKDESA